MALDGERVRELVVEMQAADRHESVDKLKVDMGTLQKTIQRSVGDRLGKVLAVHITSATTPPEQLKAAAELDEQPSHRKAKLMGVVQELEATLAKVVGLSGGCPLGV